MPEFQMPPTESVVFHNLPPFTQGYIEAMFFTGASDPDDELHGCTFDGLSPEALAQIQTDCTGFVGLASEVLANARRADPAYDLTRAGGDFWYTRNGHGVGFWDRGCPSLCRSRWTPWRRRSARCGPTRAMTGRSTSND